MGFQEEKRRNGNHHSNATATTFNCTETRNHVHYPPRQRTRSLRLNHPSTRIPSSGFDQKSHAAGNIRYRECLKNQASGVGGIAYDGCGEFFPASDGDAMKCGACGCHRCFHRIEPAGDTIHHHNCVGTILSPLQLPSLHFHQNPSSATAASFLTAGGRGGGGTDSSSEDRNAYDKAGGNDRTSSSSAAGSKKRFRTKFKAEQKEKMAEFAEKLGWRLSKQNDEEMEKFCGEIGVKRQVFKVWMHNHKTKWR